MRRNVDIALLVLGLTLVFVSLLAAGETEEAASAEQAMAEQVEAWMKYAGPGEHHEHLRKLVGQWKAHSKFWPIPDAPAVEAHGTAQITSVLGGRFVRTDYRDESSEERFVGFGLDGYDNYSGKHIGMWTDTMSTTIMMFEGNCEEGGKVRTMVSAYDDPATGERKTMRGVTTIIDDNTFKWVAYDQGADGKETKTMEIVYTRQ